MTQPIDTLSPAWFYDEVYEAEFGGGDVRRCASHPEVVISSPDGLHDGCCHLCEARCDEDFEAEEAASVDGEVVS